MRRSSGFGAGTRLALVAVAIAAGSMLVTGQITVPNTFVNGTVADAPQVNANFNALASNALNRTGGTMTGTLTSRDVTPSADATYALGSGTFRFTNLFLSGTLNVPGTSGGLLYFNTATTAASSAALAATALVVGGGAGVAPSTNSNFTINASNMLSSATQARAVAFNSAGQSITTGNTTALTLNSEDVDVGTMHDTVTNNSRVTVPTGGDGFYLVLGFVSVQSAAGAPECSLILRKNGATQLQEAKSTISAGLFFVPQVVVTGLALVATDYVELLGKANGNTCTFGTGTRQDAVTLSVVKLW